MNKQYLRLPIDELIPYENNPRINDDAVDAVAKSIEQCGYIAPIITDESMVIMGGHTRVKAMKRLGIKECEVLVVSGLSEEQNRQAVQICWQHQRRCCYVHNARKRWRIAV